jgi:hypothetical protein
MIKSSRQAFDDPKHQATPAVQKANDSLDQMAELQRSFAFAAFA